MNDNTADDQAMIAEALRRMKSGKPGIPGSKVIEFLHQLNAEWDQASVMSEEQLREKFERFVAEAPHVQR